MYIWDRKHIFGRKVPSSSFVIIVIFLHVRFVPLIYQIMNYVLFCFVLFYLHGLITYFNCVEYAVPHSELSSKVIFEYAETTSHGSPFTLDVHEDKIILSELCY